MAILNPFRIKENFERASAISEDVPRMLKVAEGQCARQREDTRLALRKLGKLKRDCFKNGGAYERLRAKLCSFALPDDFQIHFAGQAHALPSLVRSQRCEQVCDTATAIAEGALKGVAAGATSGALVSFAAYSLVGTFASAGTGTAIASLSGAAALKATLAWLGGGTLAAGGLGVAGGTAALVSLAALPALLILGVSLGSKSEQMLAESEAALAQAKETEEKFQTVIEKTRQIAEVAILAHNVLKRLSSMADCCHENLSSITATCYEQFTEEQKEECYKGYRLCELLNNFASIDILDTEGDLSLEASEQFVDIDESLDIFSSEEE